MPLISALDGERSTPRRGRFTPGENPRYPFQKRLGGPKILSPVGNQTPVFHPVARRYNGS
jgi:hypothetical protein